MFEVTLKQLMDLRNLLPEIEKIPLPLKAVYPLTKIKDKADSNFPFYQEKIRTIVLDCAELDEQGNLIQSENGQGFKLKSDKQVEFFEKMGELESLSVEIEGNKIPYAGLEDASFSLDTMTILLPFIEE